MDNKTSDQSRLHYTSSRFADEKPELKEAEYHYRNVGWSLGNDCPMNCKQCYSRSAREKGANLTKPLIDRVISQLKTINAETVNLGGNEPIYTNGLDPSQSLLPYILEQLNKNGMKVGVTTAGPTLTQLERLFPDSIKLINDVDISLDSPREEEHDENRGRPGIYKMALETIAICQKYKIPHSIIMCGMKWNFTADRINEMIDLAKKTDSNFRVNPLKPVEKYQMDLALSPRQFFEGLKETLKRCSPIDLSDPAWACSVGMDSKIVSGCPCGTNSFRIHSITPDGKLPISPCVYLHDFKYGDLLTEDLLTIINSTPFKVFRRRKLNPEAVDGCSGCKLISVCGGGCASRAYLHNLHESSNGERTLFSKDPYCPKDTLDIEMPTVKGIKISAEALVHMGYLCTGIFEINDK